MIYRRSRTVTVEHNGVTWLFERPPGSVLLGWGPRVAELANPPEGAGMPVTVDNFRDMVGELARWCTQIDGAPCDYDADALDSMLLPSDTIAVWAQFFAQCSMGDETREKSGTPSG